MWSFKWHVLADILTYIEYIHEHTLKYGYQTLVAKISNGEQDILQSHNEMCTERGSFMRNLIIKITLKPSFCITLCKNNSLLDNIYRDTDVYWWGSNSHRKIDILAMC